ncbi:TldD/PmbA family protein [Peptococcaceae bacterium]|nr:TldD/PmbA family protein [Peptococcaceae bacterium]
MDKKDLQKILDAALANGGDFADIFIEQKKVAAISMESDKIERIQSGYEKGAGIRVFFEKNTSYAYTNDLSIESLLRAADIVSRAVRSKKGEYNLDLTKTDAKVQFDIDRRPDDVSINEKVEVVKRANDTARSVDKEKIAQVMIGYGDIIQKVTIANSNGDYVEDDRIRTRLTINAVARSGENVQTGYEAVGANSGFELFDEADVGETAKIAAKRAVEILDARPAPSGKMPCVMAGEAGGTMVHEACGHGLEADLVQRGLSVYAGKKGEQVASEMISVLDDATIQGKYGSYRFDDEGIEARPVELIKNGILVDFLYDRLTAYREGIQSNGHGRRQSYKGRPIPRMANTYIAPGNMVPEKIIKDTKSGLFVKKMGGGQVNTITGDFVFDVSEGYIIKDGEIGEMVKGATLTGNGPEVLRIIDMVGNDLGYTIGTCGKDGQGVPVVDAQPTMRIPEIIVGGTVGPVSPSGEIKRLNEAKPTKKYKIRKM